jgi:hypothetical protein
VESAGMSAIFSAEAFLACVAFLAFVALAKEAAK